MIAFDTNLLVRLAAADDAKQLATVRRLIAKESVFISRTVMLETEWVLRSRYKIGRTQLHAFFVALLETDDVVVENATEIARALDWFLQGADFADALHLAICGDALMHTFDQDFCKAARDAGDAPKIRVLKA